MTDVCTVAEIRLLPIPALLQNCWFSLYEQIALELNLPVGWHFLPAVLECLITAISFSHSEHDRSLRRWPDELLVLCWLSQWLQVISGTLALVIAHRHPLFFGSPHWTVSLTKLLKSLPNFSTFVIYFHCCLSVLSLSKFWEKKEANGSRHWERKTRNPSWSRGWMWNENRWEWLTADGGFSNLFYVCLIRTRHSWCTLSTFWWWIFSRLLQDQLHRAIREIASEKCRHHSMCFICYGLHCA